MPSPMKIVPHDGRASESCETSYCDRRRVGIGIHLQRGADEPIDGVLPGKLAQNPVRAKAAIFSGKSASSTGRRNTCLQFTGRGLEL